MEQILQYVITGYIIIISLVGFISMGVDKRRAVKRAWRIPERTLLFIACFGGGIGSFLGMYTFRHKTKHIRFIIILPLCAFIYIALLLKIYRVI